MSSTSRKDAVSHKRSRRGCLTCRARHYKCDEKLPVCRRCRNATILCKWPVPSEPDNSPEGLAMAMAIPTSYDHQSVAGNVTLARDSENRRGVSPLDSFICLDTRSTDSLIFYTSKFPDYSFDLCNWTDLIELPKRSTLPSLLASTGRRKTRGMTNWASYLLPNLALYTDDDPLSLAMAAYSALRMQQKSLAVAFYIKVIRSLQGLLRHENPTNITNEEFLRVWTATLLLSEYEMVLSNRIAQGQHIYGATTLAFIAAGRFECVPPGSSTESTSPNEVNLTSRSVEIQSSPEEDNLPHGSSPDLRYVDQTMNLATSTGKRSISETLLPGYLLDFTRLRRNASMGAQTIDVQWPRFRRPTERRQVCHRLLDIAACVYTHVMPLIQDFYAQCGAGASPQSVNHFSVIKHLSPRYIEARNVIDKYKDMLSHLSGPEYEIERGPAEFDCPFSPIIRFCSPHMAHISAMPDVYMCLLAPFLSNEEHAKSLRYASGIFAYMQRVEGLKSTAAFPDLFIAAFWKPGIERDYFYNDLIRRKGDFMLCLREIWETVDAIGLSEQRQASKTEILGVALESYRSAMIEGFKLQHLALWQTLGMTLDPWSVAVGSVNPLESKYSTEEEKSRRQGFADVSHFHHRITVYRHQHGYYPHHDKADSNPHSQGLSDNSNPDRQGLSKDFRLLNDTKTEVTNPYAGLEYRGPDTFEEYDDSARQRVETTETGKIASKILMQDPDKTKIYYII